MSEDTSATYARRVGARLRNVRRQQRLSLQGVEAASGREFRASVLGAYERGERAISVPRLQRLAELYHLPVDRLLPRDTTAGPDWQTGEADRRPFEGSPGRVTVDLSRLEVDGHPEQALLARYVRALQLQREDFAGRIMTIRDDDVRAIACMLGTEPQQMRRRLAELGFIH